MDYTERQKAIKYKKLQLTELDEEIKVLKRKLASVQSHRTRISGELTYLKKEDLLLKYKLKLNQTILKNDGNEYLLVDIDYLERPVVKSKNKNGSWSKRKHPLSGYCFETKKIKNNIKL